MGILHYLFIAIVTIGLMVSIYRHYDLRHFFLRIRHGKKMGRIVVIVGSLSDLSQARKGLELLLKMQDRECIMVDVYIASQHRNTEQLQLLLKSLARSYNSPLVIIAAAGWANHLTGCVDAFFRYIIKNFSINVIGVGFEDKKKINTQAAYLSMACVPGTQVILDNGDKAPFMGKVGFFKACEFALKGEFPKITVPKKKKFIKFTLREAVNY